MRVIIDFQDLVEGKYETVQSIESDMSSEDIEFFVKHASEPLVVEGIEEHTYTHFSSSFVLGHDGKLVYRMLLREM
ncbi:hypothetical protein [Anoxybacteroides tepidamans]|uniref:hypothetical protein n=1 Tax=Anoxybacteroides tepidamans TaxID=265948 RepID=UPI00048A1AD0|nr:hypothetical protein [Anoxybacillus tepidamans]